MREGRLESILHSELFIHQHNLQSFEERRDVQASHPEMFARHCKTRCAMSVRVCLCMRGHAYVPAESALSVKQSKRFD